MKVLKIDNGKCYFSTDGNINKSICDIGKEDLLKILDVIYSDDECEIDEFGANIKINNDAERIIYESIYTGIIDYKSKINILKKEIENEFSKVIEKYSEE